MNKPPIPIDSAFVCEHAEDSNMILTLMTKVGTFEFTFTPSEWERLGATAGWFKAQVAAIEVTDG